MVQVAIDLGAAPGAWTELLASTGAETVFAVDPADLSAQALALPAVQHVRKRSGDAVPDIRAGLRGRGVDIIVCDMNQLPQECAPCIAPLLPLLAPGGHVVMTCKFTGNGRERCAACARGRVACAAEHSCCMHMPFGCSPCGRVGASWASAGGLCSFVLRFGAGPSAPWPAVCQHCDCVPRLSRAAPCCMDGQHSLMTTSCCPETRPCKGAADWLHEATASAPNVYAAHAAGSVAADFCRSGGLIRRQRQPAGRCRPLRLRGCGVQVRECGQGAGAAGV